MNHKTLGKSKEDYLKAILIIQEKFGACRVVDVSNHMEVSKSSASSALKKLEQDGFVTKSDWRILLTDAGREVAERLYETDLFFARWFEEIGVSRQTAQADACKIEHAISEETYRKIKEYIVNLEGRCANA